MKGCLAVVPTNRRTPNRQHDTTSWHSSAYLILSQKQLHSQAAGFQLQQLLHQIPQLHLLCKAHVQHISTLTYAALRSNQLSLRLCCCSCRWCYRCCRTGATACWPCCDICFNVCRCWCCSIVCRGCCCGCRCDVVQHALQGCLCCGHVLWL